MILTFGEDNTICFFSVIPFCWKQTVRFIRPARAPVFGEGEPQRENPPRAAPEMRFGSKV